MEKTSPPHPHIAIFPSPGMGHLIPLVQFAKTLHTQYKITATFIIPTDGPLSKAQHTFLHTLPPGLDFLVLPQVSLDDLADDVKIETRLSLMVSRSLPSLRDTCKAMISSKRLVAFVVDLFGTDAFDVAKEFNVSPYIFYPTNAMVLSLFLHLPELDEGTDCEYRDLPDPVQLPGCVPIYGKNLLDPVQDRKNEAYKWVLHHCKKYKMAEGIMVNSFVEMEEGAIKALQELGSPPVYPVGPLVQMDSGSESGDGSGCLRWLDSQPRGSVLFISFGSGGTLTSNQITELALGLEMSEQRFLWVIRSPNDEIANASYFNEESRRDPLGYLPKGFVERTKGRGLVVPSWAPQAQILSHGSTGGFLTHCGWNSVLETVVNGVPIIAWPLYAEQRMNAVMLSEGLKVALRVQFNENDLVGRVEIANIVKGLMEGEDGKRLRTRMRDLKDAASKAVSDVGSSTSALAQVAAKWNKE